MLYILIAIKVHASSKTCRGRSGMPPGESHVFDAPKSPMTNRLVGDDPFPSTFSQSAALSSGSLKVTCFSKGTEVGLVLLFGQSLQDRQFMYVACSRYHSLRPPWLRKDAPGKGDRRRSRVCLLLNLGVPVCRDLRRRGRGSYPRPVL